LMRVLVRKNITILASYSTQIYPLFAMKMGLLDGSD